MRYLLLLANAPDAWEDPGAGPDDGAGDGVIGDWVVYTRALRAAGVLVDGVALADAGAATTVQVRQGRRLLTDGPFADTKEHLVGIYLLEVGHLDEALDWAARAPNARTGSVEVRPVRPGSDPDTVLATGLAPGSPS